ncbi:MAG: hypothetical protein DME26_14330 [Verrucomicrobia bacterium]|nr:MAG: hypothetical protein DME26_14330 [Verrucomicrobiota bacterium]
MRAFEVVEATHEPGAESSSKLAAFQTLARQDRVSEYREAFGVRPACRRFRWFRVSMRNRKVVEALHEPERRSPIRRQPGVIGKRAGPKTGTPRPRIMETDRELWLVGSPAEHPHPL